MSIHRGITNWLSLDKNKSEGNQKRLVFAIFHINFRKYSCFRKYVVMVFLKIKWMSQKIKEKQNIHSRIHLEILTKLYILTLWKSTYIYISDKTYIYLKHLNTIYIHPLHISFEHIASLDFLKRPRKYF